MTVKETNEGMARVHTGVRNLDTTQLKVMEE